jgi:hypothetical protein
MGNFHCVPSGCAEVVYREYLPPTVRYRYPGEDWQEIVGADDYSVNIDWQHETTNNFNYTFKAKARCSTSSPPPGVAPSVPRNFVAGQEIEVFTTGIYSGPIYSVEKKIVDNGSNVNVDITFLERTGGNSTAGICAKRVLDQILRTSSSTGSSVRVKNVSGSYREPVVYGDIYDIQFTPTTTPPRACINGITNECTFKVFKQDAIIHQETRSVCPEVEKLPCRLSDEVKKIQIEKIPYLERVEVRNQSIEPIYLPPANVPLLDVKSLPNECLSIYNTYILAAPFLSDYVPLPGIINPYQFIAQICSAPGCSPPEYGVVCNTECLECIECPPGTHPLICDSTVCCYGSDGKVVLEIPKLDYCGGDSCCE